MQDKPKFTNRNQSEFFSTLKKRADGYFNEKGISPYANAFMVFKIVFFLTVFTGIFLFLLLGNYNLAGMFGLWILLCLFTAFVGVNVCHDASHGSISSNKTVNKTLSYIFNLIGTNEYVWKI